MTIKQDLVTLQCPGSHDVMSHTHYDNIFWNNSLRCISLFSVVVHLGGTLITTKDMGKDCVAMEL